MDRINSLWAKLYPQHPELIADLSDYLHEAQQLYVSRKERQFGNADELWYRDAVVYSLYVDLFAEDFPGLIKRLDSLVELGVNTLWLLPILQSPMKDYGFDVSDYFRVREELLDASGQDCSQEKFFEFVMAAHSRGMRLIFDIPLNHCSVENVVFKDVLQNPDSPYRDHFIWSPEGKNYEDCRILFKGMMESNWEYSPERKEYFFHRFYHFQPDWNYLNPAVMFQSIKILCYWKINGIDGFRLDAVPFLWKKEGTDCENLPEVHLIIKLLRSCLDFVAPGTFLLAEACQPPQEVVRYFGDGDEVHAAYHFPLMPQIYHSLALGSAKPVQEVLSERVTPDIPENCVWFTFLRCHDELTLEFATPEERKTILQHFCHEKDWNFRQGEGISARLANLFKNDAERILLAYSILLTIEGAPIVYYGDEFAWPNDEDFYRESIVRTGCTDSRNLVRGPIDWQRVSEILSNEESAGSQVFNGLKHMISLRKKLLGTLITKAVFLQAPDSALCYERVNTVGEKFLFVHNLSNTESVSVELPVNFSMPSDAEQGDKTQSLHLKPSAFCWIKEIKH
jgi:maltose alpha-D-glucosyltransferase/alpha-amylase